jgi:hypothetical protein
MKKIRFSQHVLPHLVAVVVFLIVTVFFFKPVFFDNKTLNQADIQQWEGSSKHLRDYRNATGREGLWAESMFSGMPAYLINVEWGNQAVSVIKRVLTLSLPHPVSNTFAAFVAFYILLLTFGVRPYLAIAGAIAFGLSSYMVIGIMAGHNARIGAIAFMPLVIAGIHLVFSGRRIIGFGVTAAGFALHLRENHLQITYYLAIIVVVYGIVQLINLHRANQLKQWGINVALLVPAIAIAIATFFGPLWAITEYSAYSIRGKSEVVTASGGQGESGSGLSKTYAFEFSNGILEPMTLIIPNFYGGATSNYLVQDQDSETFNALMRSNDQQTANQLAPYTSAYWGPQRLAAPYYAGAIVVFLFVAGIFFSEKKWVWWLAGLTALSIILSWGSSLQAFNYFVFDYVPGYNKFRSVTFALVIALFSMPLLGMIGLERLLITGVNKETKRTLLIVLGISGGICVVAMLLSGLLSFQREFESQLPPWFLNALTEDRRSLLVGDAFRSLIFIASAFIVLYFDIYKKISPVAFYAFFVLMITIDLAVVDRRYLKEENYSRGREKTRFASTEADQEIQKDKSHYRVYNLQNSMSDAWNEARTSYFHNSIGGYHGAKMKRYQDLLDSCLYRETAEFVRDAQAGQIRFGNYGILNMLNTKYVMFGQQRNNILLNDSALGNAWFVQNVEKVNSPAEELAVLCETDTRTTAVVDVSRFQVSATRYDSGGTITLTEVKPDYLKYESNSPAGGMAMFSEIYYEKGWRAFIDGSEVPVIRANYVLRALHVPAGKHTVEFRFEPAAYYTGNVITKASSWLMLLILLGTLGYSLRKEE